MLLEARVLLRQSKPGDARRIFTDLATAYPNSPSAQVANSEVARLDLMTIEQPE